MKKIFVIGLLCVLISANSYSSDPDVVIDQEKGTFELRFGPISRLTPSVAEYIDEVDQQLFEAGEIFDLPKTLIIKPAEPAANDIRHKKLGIRIPDYSQYSVIKVLDLQTNCNIYNFGEVFGIYQRGLEELVVSDNTSYEYFYREDYDVRIDDLKAFINSNLNKKEQFDSILNKYNIDYAAAGIAIRGTEIIKLLEIAGINIVKSIIN